MIKKKIFIVDDEINLAKILKLNLEDTGKYVVEITGESTKAIDKMRSFQPDLAFIDIMMPGIQGDKIAEMMLDDNELNQVKIIFLSATKLKKSFSRHTAVIEKIACIRKPVRFDALVSVLENALGID